MKNLKRQILKLLRDDDDFRRRVVGIISEVQGLDTKKKTIHLHGLSEEQQTKQLMDRQVKFNKRVKEYGTLDED